KCHGIRLSTSLKSRNSAMAATDLHMIDNAGIKGREDRYTVVRVDTAKTLKSWQSSLFSFEWLTPDGAIRATDDLPLRERDRRIEAEKALKGGASLERPILGIGIMDNVEIGAGRAVFLTLA